MTKKQTLVWIEESDLVIASGDDIVPAPNPRVLYIWNSPEQTK